MFEYLQRKMFIVSIKKKVLISENKTEKKFQTFCMKEGNLNTKTLEIKTVWSHN